MDTEVNIFASRMCMYIRTFVCIIGSDAAVSLLCSLCCGIEYPDTGDKGLWETFKSLSSLSYTNLMKRAHQVYWWNSFLVSSTELSFLTRLRGIETSEYTAGWDVFHLPGVTVEGFWTWWLDCKEGKDRCW